MKVLFAAAAATAFAGAAVAQDLEICVEGAYPPFSQISDSGEIEGFDIDVARALCDQMGASCDLVVTEWDAIIPSLEENKCDAIIASMSITEERMQRIDFSGKYQQTPFFFVAEDDTDLEATNESLSGKTVCVQRGTIHQDLIEAKFPDADVALYPTQDEVYLDMTAGRCDAMMADSVAVQYGFLDTAEGEGFAFFGPDQTDPAIHGQGAGVAVRKGETDLADRFTAAIRAIRENGVYKAINDQYFGFDVYGADPDDVQG